MNIQKYLQTILNQHSIDENSSEIISLRKERKSVEEILRNAFKDSTIDIQYAGSYKKGTMIRDSYDLDIISYFDHDDKSPGDTLEEIFNNVQTALKKKYKVDPKKSALRLKSNSDLDFHIDVVPGRFIDKKKDDVFLYQSFGEKGSLKTNLRKHIDHIKNSNLTDTIKLIKVWKEINSVNVKTFILELLVIKVLARKKDSDGFESCLTSFWKEMKDNINEITIEDPANPSGNDLSHLFDANLKSYLSSASKKILDAVENGNWEDVFGPADDIDDDRKLESIQTIKKESDFPKPWCNI